MVGTRFRALVGIPFRDCWDTFLGLLGYLFGTVGIPFRDCWDMLSRSGWSGGKIMCIREKAGTQLNLRQNMMRCISFVYLHAWCGQREVPCVSITHHPAPTLRLGPSPSETCSKHGMPQRTHPFFSAGRQPYCSCVPVPY